MKQMILAFLFLIAAVPLLAQDGGGVDYPDYDMGGGGGGPWGDSMCKVCVYQGNQAGCVPHFPGPDYTGLEGHTGCTAHNVPIGPGFCEFSGDHCYAWDAYIPSSNKLAQEQAIVAYLLESRLMSMSDLDDFVAQTDNTHRLEAYRAKFAEVTGVKLKQGAIPVMPRPRIKAAGSAAI